MGCGECNWNGASVNGVGLVQVDGVSASGWGEGE